MKPGQLKGKKTAGKGRKTGGTRGTFGRPPRARRKACRFCVDKSEADYKDAALLRHFISERGRILPRRVSGLCAKHQRFLSQSIKRARIIALLPYTTA